MEGTRGLYVPSVRKAEGKREKQVAISFSNACMHAKSLQLCPTLCGPMDSSPPGSSAHRILQEWIDISFSKMCP